MMNICPMCKEQMKPLLYGSYCPNDCDLKEVKTSVVSWCPLLGTPRSKWQWALAPPGVPFPKDATHATWVGISTTLVDIEILRMVQDINITGTPGWEITKELRQVKTSSENSQAIAFKRVG